MFSSIQSIPGLIFARSYVKAKIRPGVEANVGSCFHANMLALNGQHVHSSCMLYIHGAHFHQCMCSKGYNSCLVSPSVMQLTQQQGT